MIEKRGERQQPKCVTRGQGKGKTRVWTGEFLAAPQADASICTCMQAQAAALAMLWADIGCPWGLLSYLLPQLGMLSELQLPSCMPSKLPGIPGHDVVLVAAAAEHAALAAAAAGHAALQQAVSQLDGSGVRQLHSRQVWELGCQLAAYGLAEAGAAAAGLGTRLMQPQCLPQC